MKNTAPVVEAWLRHPEWPNLTVVSHRSEHQYLAEECRKARNIKFITDWLSDEDRRWLRNIHGVHICPSEMEGFGHYINEARSVKALVIGSNASPMNELVQENENGILIGRMERQGHFEKAKVTVGDVEDGVMSGATSMRSTLSG